MIEDNVKRILKEIPSGVQLVAAAKTRTPEDIARAIEAGIRIIGENYVQEAQRAQAVIGRKARWHFIGHLQTNKVKKAVEIFDMIETVDSMKLAREIADKGLESSMSDVGVGARMAHAGMHGAILNVKINLGSIKDQKFVDDINRKIKDIISSTDKKTNKIIDIVEKEM